MQLLIAIQIGLSLQSCDPESSFVINFYKRTFVNKSNKTLRISYQDGNRDAHFISLKPNEQTKIMEAFSSSVSEDGVVEGDFKMIIERNISRYDDGVFEVYENDSLLKKWSGVSGYLMENSPFNYNSWKPLKYETPLETQIGNFVYGELIFTITDEDLK